MGAWTIGAGSEHSVTLTCFLDLPDFTDLNWLMILNNVKDTAAAYDAS